jgi:hypothetical protein
MSDFSYAILMVLFALAMIVFLATLIFSELINILFYGKAIFNKMN